MARVNTVQLEAVIAECVNLSMDGQILDVAQERYMENAMLLRRRFVVLKAKDFGDGDESVKNANLLLPEASDRLADVKAGVGNVADSIAVLGKIIGELDKLVTLVELTLESRLPRIYGDPRADFPR